ncbi:tyrosine-protein phosphatase non-receptor type 9-like [Saccoglossus kowalevskii]|uniref:Tyrosine-protein phosphatase non-receptor type 9-like n=1 Tax=Saccoglossus kowalevskii TaxID=10224 RepID=A0ABM0GZ28_SACKO|nr:PREDICTED: tyrosine-protein phosphatase non-receptor type 9-like [Saccoglossus kowalevskii]
MGAAIALFTAKLHLPHETTKQNVLKSVLYQLDQALEDKITQRNGMVFVFDMTGSTYSNFDYELSQKILDLLKGGYPARLKKVIIVTAPLWFRAPFKILRLFVREKLRDRVVLTNITDLPQVLPKESLPKQMNGPVSVDHKDWLSSCYNTYKNKESREMEDLSADNRALIANERAALAAARVVSAYSDESPPEIRHSRVLESEKNHKELVNTAVRNDADPLLADSCDEPSATTTAEIHTVPDPSYPHVPPPPVPRKLKPGVPSDEPIHKPESGGMTVDMLINHLQSVKKSGIYKEYAKIRLEPPTGTFQASRLKVNAVKNRYTDVPSYDHTRVPLNFINGDPNSDYINANYMDGYKQKNAFIAAQGPLPKTFADYWRMIWEQTVLVIVMTTRTVERGRLKCGQYWPNEENSTEVYGDVSVINKMIEKKNDYTISTLQMRNSKTDEVRDVTHFQFTSWPDFGVPSSAAAMLDFLSEVRSYQARNLKSLGDQWQGHTLGPPILVHCSAGIGRTGTFCTLDISLARLNDIGTIDVKTTVQRMRTQRAFTIQTPDQYEFCHFAVIEYAQRQGIVGEIDFVNYDDTEDSDSD